MIDKYTEDLLGHGIGFKKLFSMSLEKRLDSSDLEGKEDAIRELLKVLIKQSREIGLEFEDLVNSCVAEMDLEKEKCE